MTDSPALLVEVTRGDTIESRHSGAVAIADVEGRILFQAGDVETPVFPRSAIKPLQALPLIESGAADAFGVDEIELALSCASHSGELSHVTPVGSWLGRMGLDATALGCGTHWPSNEEAARALARTGAQPSALHNNCSGKHTGMLCACLHRGDDLATYLAFDHPAQRGWIDVIGEFGGLDPLKLPRAIDGCSIPTLAMPTTALARAFARFASPRAFSAKRQAAVARVQRAMAAAPFFVAGSDRFCTLAMEATDGALLVKTGAEGVYIGAVPKEGLGFALKITDGATRASQIAIAALVRRALGAEHKISRALEPLATAKIETRKGLQVGVVRAAGALA
ncbi:asparaginase [Roseiterribacter gracilis]|uniref:Asparaginase n=1 Tax=Roseiterribacter gracilis TaxID=2812848 RepID=A0A8S8XCC7_9PROT|nr:asparaginase [Rhodospirillales bacterium TMPK1]